MNNRNRPPLTEKEAMKKALRRKTRYRMPSVNIGVLIIVLLFLIVIGVSVFVIMSRDSGDSPAVSESVAVTDEGESGGDESPEPSGVVVTLSGDDVYEGELILVNSDHAYKFPESPFDVCVYDNKSSSYKVGDKNVTLSMTAIEAFNKLMDDFYAETSCHDVMIVSGGGFRTEEFQRELYAKRVETQGAEMAAKYVALPGHSEHHTGLAMDLSVYTDAGEGFPLRTYEGCKWLVENFENYGFILRYPESKADITGINYESWHYRYVGTPHSLIMKEKDWVHEEYTDYLQNLPEGTALSWNGVASEEVSLDGMIADYAIYYVPASESGDTEITIPRNRDYKISGDNVSGFIVTVMPAVGGNENVD